MKAISKQFDEYLVMTIPITQLSYSVKDVS